MTMQPRSQNPIELRKQAVRRYSKRGVVGVTGGVGAGIVLGLAATSWTWVWIGLVVAVALGAYNWMKIQKIVNHRDVY